MKSRYWNIGHCIVFGYFLTMLASDTVVRGQDEIPGWGRPIDPDGDCTFVIEDGLLTVVAPGPTHGLSIELNLMNAPRVLRRVKGDFTAEVRIDTQLTPGGQTLEQRTAYQGTGLLLVNDEGNYVRLEAAALVRNNRTQHYVNFELRTDRQLQRFGTPDDFSWDGSGSLWLRLERRGNQILGAVTQEPGHWTYLNPKATEWPQNLELGVAAINASSRPLRGQFADLKVLTTEDTATEDTATDPSAE